jgi:hypothetical protein
LRRRSYSRIAQGHARCISIDPSKPILSYRNILRQGVPTSNDL